jgi:hypothetical protein
VSKFFRHQRDEPPSPWISATGDPLPVRVSQNEYGGS